VPKFGEINKISWPYQVSDLMSQDIRTVDTASDWLVGNLGLVELDEEIYSQARHFDIVPEDTSR